MKRKDIKNHCRSESEKHQLNLRLKRIEGQVRGIQKMIDSNEDCIDILRQISSISGALRGVWTSVIENHLKVCIKNSLEQKDETLVEELVQYLKKAK